MHLTQGKFIMPTISCFVVLCLVSVESLSTPTKGSGPVFRKRSPPKDPDADPRLKPNPHQMSRLHLLAQEGKPGACDVLLFEMDNFGGHHWVFSTGDYNGTAVTAKGFEGVVGSVKVVGSQCKALLWEGPWFNRGRVEFPEGEYMTEDIAIRGDQEITKSLKVIDCSSNPAACVNDKNSSGPVEQVSALGDGLSASTNSVSETAAKDSITDPETLKQKCNALAKNGGMTIGKNGEVVGFDGLPLTFNGTNATTCTLNCGANRTNMTNSSSKNVVMWWDLVPQDCAFRGQPFKMTRQEQWQEFSEFQEMPAGINCHSTTRCGGKADMCYYSVPNVSEIFQYNTYGWPVPQMTTFLGGVDVLHNKGFGNRTNYHTKTNTVWGHPNASGYSEVQGLVVYPVQKLKYDAAPQLTINVEFVPANRSEMILAHKWGSNFAKGAVEWVLFRSVDGATHNDLGENVKELARGSFSIDREGNLAPMMFPTDLKRTGIKVGCFDTGHIALWTRAIYAEQNSSPVLAFGDKHEFIWSNNTVKAIQGVDVTSKGADCFVGDYDSLDIPKKKVKSKAALMNALYESLDWW